MISFFPVTNKGQFATRFFVGFILMFIIFQLMILSGQRGGETFFSNLWLTIPFLIAIACAIAGFVYGSISIVREKERSIAVFIATVVGFLVLLFISAEILFPH